MDLVDGGERGRAALREAFSTLPLGWENIFKRNGSWYRINQK